MTEWTDVPVDFVVSKDLADKRARLRRGPVAVELRFPIGKWQKPEDMIGHHARVEANGLPFGEYLASAVDDRGRVVLEPVHIDSDYDWSVA